MTDQELDAFFIQTLKAILADIRDCRAYVNELHTPEYDEIKQDYDEAIQRLGRLLKKLRTVDDLALLDEEAITAVYDYIETYADNFIINAEPLRRQKDLEEYARLEELLNLFVDADDFDDEDF